MSEVNRVRWVGVRPVHIETAIPLQLTITDSATAIDIASFLRECIAIKNHGPENIYIGFDGSVAADSGYLLLPDQDVVFEGISSAIYAITAQNTAVVSRLAFYTT